MVAGVATHTRLVRSDDGLWEVNGERRPDLAGVVDLDIQCTPATNALPIRRLELNAGESREVDAAWVRVPDLQVERLPQKYTRVQDREYRYESGGGAFAARVLVDEAGFVERYGDVWSCVGKG